MRLMAALLPFALAACGGGGNSVEEAEIARDASAIVTQTNAEVNQTIASIEAQLAMDMNAVAVTRNDTAENAVQER